METDRKGIIDILVKIDFAWVENRFDEIQAYLDDNVYFYSVFFDSAVQGKNNYIDKCREIIEHYVIKRFDHYDFIIEYVGDKTILRYTFSIEYEIDNMRIHKTGTDVLIFRKHSDKWQIESRIMQTKK